MLLGSSSSIGDVEVLVVVFSVLLPSSSLCLMWLYLFWGSLTASAALAVASPLPSSVDLHLLVATDGSATWGVETAMGLPCILATRLTTSCSSSFFFSFSFSSSFSFS
jgi:hypothetical protein